MKTRKFELVISLLALGLFATSALAEAPAAPSSIDPNDHAALAAYYDGLAKEVSDKLEASQQALKEYEEHPYTYGRQGQDLNGHLHANIREYNKELNEDLEQVELHKKLTSVPEDKQINKAKANLLNESVVR